ncbi:MAG: outer membrane beta-barrel protein [Alphaproteobacteria bacterium]|nr:outer membrane beta-barrel protein [Alphaproteobacteria bacterium]
MKKILLTSLVATLAVSAANALTVSPYVGAHMAYNNSEIETTYKKAGIKQGTETTKFSGNLGYGAAIGAKFDFGCAVSARAEAEFSRTQVKMDGDVKGADGTIYGYENMEVADNVALFNVYGDIDTTTAFTPYISAGIGYHWAKSEYGDYDREDGKTSKDKGDVHDIAWQLGAGVSYAANEHVSLDLGYRYLRADWSEDKTEAGVKTEWDTDFTTHQVRFGAKYTF